MTDDDAVRDAFPKTLGGLTVAELLVPRVPALSRAVLQQLRRELPIYRSMPGDVMASVLATTDRTIRGFITVAETGEMPSADVLARLRAGAAHSAQERFPLEVLMAAYQVGMTVVVDDLRKAVGPDDAETALEVAALGSRYLQLVLSAIFGGYLEEREFQVGDAETSRQALVQALLEGGDVGRAAAEAGLVLPRGLLVVHLAIDADEDERSGEVDHALATAAKLRRVRLAVEQRTRGRALTQLSAGGGFVLIPREDDGPELRSEESVLLEDLHDAVLRAAGAPTTGGVAPCATKAAPNAATLAHEVRRVAQASGRAEGIYGLDDVLLEYQLTRPGPALDRLARLLVPLDAKPDLRCTLDAYLESGLDRRATAGRLHVHPNTVDYRLGRVAELTGIDPMSAVEQARLRAAIVAHDTVHGGRRGMP